MKKVICAVCLILLFICISTGAFAAPVTLVPIDAQEDYLPDPPEISSKKAIVVDNQTGTILYSKGNLTAKLFPASITKILTALVVIENVSDTDGTMVTVSRKACNLTAGSSIMGLQANDELSVTDLLYGMLLRSGNDAALALAEFVAGDITGFVSMMNKKAKDLGAKNTNFANPHGLHNEDHYSCLNDMAIFACTLTQNEMLSDIVSAPSHIAKIKRGSNNINLEMLNTHQFINTESVNYNKYFTGLKTGTTTSAGYCLASRYQKSGDLIILTFDGSADTCYSDNLKLAEFADTSFVSLNLKNVFSARDFVIKVDNASPADEENGQLKLQLTDIPDTTYITTKTLAQAIMNNSEPVRIVLPESLSAPIYIGDSVGKIIIYLDDDILLEGELMATRTVLDHIDMPDDLIALTIQSNKPSSVFNILLTCLGVLAGIIILFSIFFLIKLMIYNKKQRASRKSNIYARRSRTQSYQQ